MGLHTLNAFVCGKFKSALRYNGMSTTIVLIPTTYGVY